MNVKIENCYEYISLYVSFLLYRECLNLVSLLRSHSKVTNWLVYVQKQSQKGDFQTLISRQHAGFLNYSLVGFRKLSRGGKPLIVLLIYVL